MALAARIAQGAGKDKDASWNVFNVLHTAASRVAGLDLGFVPGPKGLDAAGIVTAAGTGAVSLVWLLGADEIDTTKLGKAFVIYQGSHGDAGAHRADVILPGAAYTEKSATYVNFEGRAQTTGKAVFAPGESKEDWTILRAISGTMGSPLPYDSLPALRAAMYKVAPLLARLDALDLAPGGIDALIARGGTIGTDAFTPSIRDFYLTNPIARASAVMAEMSALKKSFEQGATGTHG